METAIVAADTPQRRANHLAKIRDQQQQLQRRKNGGRDEDENCLPVKLEICGNVRNLSVQLFKMTHLISLNIKGNALEYLPKDVGKLINLHTLNLADNRLEFLPKEIGRLINIMKLNLSNNMLKHLPSELGKLFMIKHLKLNGNPLEDFGLSQMVSKDEPSSQIIQYLLNSHQVKLTHLPTRTYKQLAIPQSSTSYRFSIMSFNILYERYCSSTLYPYCPNWARDWEYRKKIIFDQLINANTDIIALQEIGTGQFNQFFLPELAKIGYAGIFYPKTRSQTMSNDEKVHVDGCAIFFKLSKFIMVKEYVLEFNKSLSQFSSGCDPMHNRVLMRDNIASAALLKLDLPDEEIAPDKIGMILVVNTHIHWNPDFSDVKIVQTAILAYLVNNILNDYCITHNIPQGTIPVILCGDFNSTPDSSVINFITNGLIKTDDPVFQGFDYDVCLSEFVKKFEKDGQNFYVNDLPLMSSYNLEKGSKTVQYTNYTYFFREIIDYIFYNSSLLRPISVLGDIDYSWFEQNEQYGMPNPYFPSDHIPLVSEFEWLSFAG